MPGASEHHDPERLETALERFRLFFDELRGLYLEREDVIDQAAMALLSREHSLITGPPGTAKSGLASAIVGRIVDERSGAPSLFSRQITESTVQTDLVGPIDFKALTETGRTEHFTDEGMLGAVHAHLDEVLDGRDMLLRATLNLLHERELKQGPKVVRGAIECALMTTNRYLAEVLEDSRERLLAFVDRIAYVGFVPKGFADPANLTRVLEVQAGGRRPPAPSALLTVQDLDVLQDATDRATVHPALFERLAQLLAGFDRERGEALRADPSFVPTRYLSTRTAVRLGRALKAACVLSAAREDPERPLVVRPDDLATLRLSLLLSGPSPREVKALLERETDPRERRQLEILRTERELFEHALAALPAPPSILSPEKQVVVRREAATLGTPAPARSPSAPPPIEPAIALVRQLASEALPAALTPEGDDPIGVASAIAQRADAIERRGGRAEGRWMRGRALAVLAIGLDTADAMTGQGLRLAVEGDGHLEWTRSAADERLRRLTAAFELRARLRARGADEDDPGALDAALKEALERASGELTTIWDEGFASAVAETLETTSADQLADVLSRLAGPLEHIAHAERALERLGVVKSELRARVVGPRIAPLVERVWQRFQATSREGVVREVALLRDRLHEVGLRGVVPPARQLEWALEALLRTVPDVVPPSTFDRAGYRALRASDPEIPLAYAAVRAFAQILGDLEALSPEEAVPKLREVLASVPEPLRARFVASDLARVESAIAFLERFWAELEERALGAVAEDRTAAPDAGKDALRAVLASDFFEITTDEAALARFDLEAQLVGLLVPSAAPAIEALRARSAALAARSRGRIHRLLQKRAEARWARMLGP